MAFLIGCSSHQAPPTQVNPYGQVHEELYSPFRPKVKTTLLGRKKLELYDWAGITGNTAAKPEYERRIFAYFQNRCGLSPHMLREVRVVRDASPIEQHEVWVYNSPTSRRRDKTSGMSVVMRYDPSSNWSEVFFIGKCQY